MIQHRRSLLLLATLWGAVGVASPATDKQAKVKFAAAQRAYSVGQFDQALQLYSDAYALKAAPAFLFNMAQCHKQLGNFERALFFYRRFLGEAPPGTDLETVNGLIAQMEKRQAEKDEAARGEADRKRLDAEAAQQLELQKAREAAARAEAEAAEQKAKLTPKPDPFPLPPPPPPPPPEIPVYKKWWFWTGVGVVVAGSATAVAIAVAPRPEIPTYGTLNAR